MLGNALLVAFSYWLCWMLDSLTSNQTCTRPIVLGTVTGLLCGDLVTGVTMGAMLEAVYMGISGIGGSLAADYRSATAISVGLAILSGITIEEGIAIAIPIGALCLSVMSITIALSNMFEGLYLKVLKTGDVKKYRLVMLFHMLFVQHLADTLVVFLCIFFGSSAIQTAFEVIPAWILTGLSASGKMLVVVGLCLTTQAIFTKSTPAWVLLGFILAKFLGLSTVVIAMLGTICSFLVFQVKQGFLNNKSVITAENENNEGDDFYE